MPLFIIDYYQEIIMETIKDDEDVGINRTISIFKNNGNMLMMKEKIGNISKGIETKEQIRN